MGGGGAPPLLFNDPPGKGDAEGAIVFGRPGSDINQRAKAKHVVPLVVGIL